MILVILGVFLALAIGSIIFGCVVDDDMGFGSFIITGLGFVVTLVITIFLTIGVSNLSVIDEKIAMYQEENTKIEEQIAETVKQYQEYETEIFTEVKPESSITLVALYPDLKSDTLVQAQLAVYIENNKQIKDLKEKQISGSVKRWWLYFGK